jgi:molecular chaperone IbpA
MTRLNFPNLLANGEFIGDMLTELSREKFPHTDILKTGDHKYVIQMGLAGYKKDNISVSVEKSVLTVEGDWGDGPEEADYVMHGISKRKFKRMFPLSEGVEVEEVQMENGLLLIDLVRIVPEKERLVEYKVN